MTVTFAESKADMQRAAITEQTMRQAEAEYADAVDLDATRGEHEGDGIARTSEGTPYDPVTGSVGTLAITKGNRTARLISLADVKPRPLHYLWHPFLREGVNILAGEGGARKSTFAAYIAAQATRGLLSDENGFKCEPQRVLYIDQGEDDLEAVLQPRFMAMNADANLVKFYQSTTVGPFGTEIPLTTSAADLNSLRTLVQEWKPGLIIVDPIAMFVDGDINSAKDVQPAMLACRELAVLAGEGAVILGLHHYNRSGTVSGSQKFIDTARSFMEIIKDPDNEDVSIMSLTKANNAALRSLKITASITDNVQAISRVEHSNVSVEDIRQSRLNGEDAEDMNDIDRWLIRYLKDNNGKAVRSDILEAGFKSKGHFSKDQLRRAKKRLHITSDNKGTFQGAWYWYLPKDMQ